MRYSIFLLLISTVLTACGFQGGTGEAQNASVIDREVVDNTIVVELFTSQGCSSCPPADQYLSELIDQNENVIALSFHVDYWNRLGWKDPYSSKDFSDRQRTYTRKLVAQTYTPQMIVNGRYEFVGSKRSKGDEVLKKAKMDEMPISIDISELNVEGDLLKFNLNISEIASSTKVNIAVVESGLSNEVTRGENAGHTLRHNNVVRVYERFDAAEAKGKHTMDLPKKLDPKNARLIAYTQNDQWEVTGANMKSIVR